MEEVMNDMIFSLAMASKINLLLDLEPSSQICSFSLTVKNPQSSFLILFNWIPCLYFVLILNLFYDLYFLFSMPQQ